MHRERVSDNVYWFQSEIYAQVVAGAVTGPNWAVIIDTLATPEETMEMRDFIQMQLNVPIRYVINTHYHADHSWGNYLFPGAAIIAHTVCREKLEKLGPASLEEAKVHNPSFRSARIVLPNITFDSGSLTIRTGKKTLIVSITPGHSDDGISVLIEEDRVLFAGDSFLPLPYIVDGDPEATIETIKYIGGMGLENIIQGHGDIILRGEIEEAVKSNIQYINCLKKAVKTASNRKNTAEALAAINIEDCGKSRVFLGGLAEELHKRNVKMLYRRMMGKAIQPDPKEII
ncbi:MAG TPA: MBL fold metallo-hydrolase [Bellilinea sp.]|nr:MBL fold metallo-hydrolase [Bellilinea sp.]